jgi:endonuclease/exonuclease/phosphatase family metal-dependent hydrolase
VRVLTWNLFHGRSRPGAGRSLLNEFAAAIAGWAWDVALLQEVPPWWPALLAAAAGGQEHSVLTSRNALLPVRRAIAERNPDLIKANGGGANAILVRGEAGDHRSRRLTRWPERRLVHGVRLGGGEWIVNLHASTHLERWARRDCLAALAAAREWAGAAPLVFGGDLNLRRPDLPGLRLVASHHVDHVLCTGLTPAGAAEVLDAGALSDHRPLAVTVG